MTECRWCGNQHPVSELCRARKVSRRMFCFALGATAVAAALPTLPGEAFVELSDITIGPPWTTFAGQEIGGDIDRLILGVLRRDSFTVTVDWAKDDTAFKERLRYDLPLVR